MKNFITEKWDTILSLIIQQQGLTEVADNLPVSQLASGNVRAGRVVAYMLKARVALYSKQYELSYRGSWYGLTG